MANYISADGGWVLDWETIAAVCSEEWAAFSQECVHIIGCKHQHMGEYSANDWLFPVCQFLQEGFIQDDALDCEGDTYEGMAQRIADLWEAVFKRFQEKTGLRVIPGAKVTEGEQEDDIHQGQHYFQLCDTHVESPAFAQFKRDYPAARPEEKAWTEGA